MDIDILKKGKAAEAVDILKGALSNKADSYEVFLSLDNGTVAEVKDGEVDSFKVRSNLGVGIRTLSGGRAGFGYSSLLDPFALTDMVDKALSGSLELSVDPNLSFPKPTVDTGVSGDDFDTADLCDPSFEEGTGASGVEAARVIEESARASDARVTKVRGASYSEASLSTRLVNSNGVDEVYLGTFFSGSISVVAEENGESQMGWEINMGHKRTDVDPELVGSSAAVRATALLGAKKPQSARCPAGDGKSRGYGTLAGIFRGLSR